MEPVVSIYMDFKFNSVGSTLARVTFYGHYSPVTEGATVVFFKPSFSFVRLDRFLQVRSETNYHEVDKTYAKTASWSEFFCHRCMFYF